MRTSTFAIMIAVGTMAIAGSAGAAGLSRVAGPPASGLSGVAFQLPRPAPSPFISPRVETASLEMLPPVMWLTAARATIPIVATPRLRMGYPYLGEMTMDGALVQQRLISSPSSVVLQGVIVVDGTSHQACARVLRIGEPSIVVAQRCFDVSIGTQPSTD
jgi:hypothetical protein